MNSYLNSHRLQKVACWILVSAIFFAYWLFSRQYHGPAYLSDEIGYLTKAAAFAGYPVDMASSWQGGYSLLLAPLFISFSDPFMLWQGVMVINALMWACSFMLLFYVLRHLFPDQAFQSIFFAVAVSAVYPAWISMSGYAFATSAFVLVYMLALAALINISEKNPLTIIPYSLLTGYLFWIHPTGVAVIAASVLIIISLAWHTRRQTFIIYHVLIVSVLIVVYKFGVHAWLNHAMTSEHYSSYNHYGSIALFIRACLNIKEYGLRWVVNILGQSSYIVIATFGIIVFVVTEASKRFVLLQHDFFHHEKRIIPALAFVFMILSMLGIILLGSLFFSSFSDQRIDQWIYGRYSEAVLLPLFAMGLLKAWRIRYAVIAGIFLMLTGLALHFISDATNTSYDIIHMTIPGFWPYSLYNHHSFLMWFGIGTVGIVLTAVLNKRYVVFLMLPLFLLCIRDQNIWHKDILAHYSKPTGIVEFVRSNFPFGSCIGFSPEKSTFEQMRERSNMYAYYFFNYKMRRMSSEEWDRKCKGPYLTYSPDEIENWDKSKAIVQEKGNGFFLVLKKDDVKKIALDYLNYDDDLYIDDTGDRACMMAGCFKMRGQELAKYSQAGIMQDGGITTNGQGGFLFYGPYFPLKKGRYHIRIDGQYENLSGAVLDVVSEAGEKKHFEIALDKIHHQTDTMIIPLSLSSDVKDLEVRLRVTEDTQLSIRSYEIKMDNGK